MRHPLLLYDTIFSDANFIVKWRFHNGDVKKLGSMQETTMLAFEACVVERSTT
jgi:hypothetical protein